jgi:hypothetical protein
MMPFVYLVLTVMAGLFFYWLRNNHRILYGTSEILAALALMYVVYFPHMVALLLLSPAGGYATLTIRQRATTLPEPVFHRQERASFF